MLVVQDKNNSNDHNVRLQLSYVAVFQVFFLLFIIVSSWFDFPVGREQRGSQGLWGNMWERLISTSHAARNHWCFLNKKTSLKTPSRLTVGAPFKVKKN